MAHKKMEKKQGGNGGKKPVGKLPKIVYALV